jgi:cytochrome c-type biogenesis protein CcmH
MMVLHPTIRVIALVFCLFSTLASANARYPFDSEKQSSQFEHLLRELRCLVCQNQDLVDSNASLAEDIRSDVYQWVKAGRSDTEITHELTARYGDFILFRPPLKWITWLLWFGPVLFLIVGVLILWRSCFRRGTHG